jgi:hypothetical protein
MSKIIKDCGEKIWVKIRRIDFEEAIINPNFEDLFNQRAEMKI